MKRLILTLALMLGLATVASAQNYAVVNSEKIFKSIEAYNAALTELDRMANEYQKQVDALFLTGDLNVEASHEAMDAIKSFMRNARTYASVRDSKSTVNGFGTSTSRKQIDHIYYSDYLKAVEYYTITDAYDGVTYVSDHYPIYAILKLKK